MKVLYIGMQVVGSPKTGGEGGQLRNRRMLRKLYGDIDVVEIPKIPILQHIKNLLLFKSYGYSNNVWDTIKNKLTNSYDYIFVDGSIYGGYIRYFKNNGFNTVVFFHNVEKEYCKQRYNSQRNLMNLALIYYIGYNEKLSVLNATKTITLNMRDNNGLKKLYGREADLILPIAHQPILQQELVSKSKEKYLVFAGADFYANNEGVLWFIQNVAPYINIEIRIVGSCCNPLERMINLEEHSNVKLLGFVDDIGEIYKNSCGVICPIFSGSGTKTKTIEALRYGKTVYGTTEAFEGIDVDYEKVGGLCNNPEEFINAINKSSLEKFNSYSYNFFMENFSTDAIYPLYEEFAKNII